MSLIEGLSILSSGYFDIQDQYAEGYPQQVRMAHLACIGSRKVNGVAEVHIPQSANGRSAKIK